MENTVTITSQGHAPKRRYTLEFSRLPTQNFGPYEFPDAAQHLRLAALLSPVEARNAVMDAAVEGTKTVECNF